MKFLPTIIAILIAPTPISAQEQSCFMRRADGRIIDLGGLCDSSSTQQPTYRPPAQPTNTAPTQSNRCPAGYKLTKIETCREINAPIVQFSPVKITKHPTNPYLAVYTFQATNLIEQPIEIISVSIQIQGANSIAAIPLLQLQPNQTQTYSDEFALTSTLTLKTLENTSAAIGYNRTREIP